MTYRKQYKQERVVVIVNLFIFCVNTFLGINIIGEHWSWPIVLASGLASLLAAIFSFFEMRKAKRYIILDNFLSEEKHESVPDDFISDEKVGTKSIAMWWKVNEEVHQN